MLVMPFDDSTCADAIFKPAINDLYTGFKPNSSIPADLSPVFINGASICYVKYSHGSMFFQRVKIRGYIFWYCHLTIEEETRIVPVNNEECLFLIYMIDGTFQWEGSGRHIRVPRNIYHLAGLGQQSDYTINLIKGKYECLMIGMPQNIHRQLIDFYSNGHSISKRYFNGYPFENFFAVDDNIKKNIRRLISGRENMGLFCSSFNSLWREEYLLRLFNQYLMGEEILFRQQKVLNTDLLRVGDIEEYVLAHFCDLARPANSVLTLRAFLKQKGVSENNFRAAIYSKYNCSWEQLVHQRRMKKAQELLLAKPYIPFREISDQLGYSSPSNFTRAIKEFYRQSPSEIRNG